MVPSIRPMTSTEAKRVIAGSMILVPHDFDKIWTMLPGLVIGTVPPDHDYFKILMSDGRIRTIHYSVCKVFSAGHI